MNNTKEFEATQKYLLMSPRKIRLIAGLVRKMKPVEAIEKLPFVQKRSAAYLAKVIKSAIASAKAQGASETDLIFKEIQIGEGPRLKRGRAASRGRWHPFKRKMSHIRVVLTVTKSETLNSKLETNSKESKAKDETKIKNMKIKKETVEKESGKEKKS